uniref:Uncharacterized protein n=1 Tax=Rhizophora mucronata TaxID=61149 RepID=A0A2P2NNB8_RHIMU
MKLGQISFTQRHDFAFLHFPDMNSPVFTTTRKKPCILTEFDCPN